MAFFRNLLVFPFKLWEIKKDISQQKSFWKTHVASIVNQYIEQPDDSLSPKEIEKLRDYYGIGSMVLAGQAIAGLHNLQLSEKEKLALTFLSSTTGLYDDFFDKHQYSAKIIQDLSAIDSEFIPENNAQKLFRELLENALKNISNKPLAIACSKDVFETQQNSLLQKDPSSTEVQLMGLSLQKGGASLLLFRSCLAGEVSAKENTLLELTGGLLQICNDIFDVAKDISEGVRTVATECNTIAELKGIVFHRMNLVQKALAAGEFKNPQKFWDRISFVTSQTLVALSHYEKLQQKSHQKFQPYSYSSQELIVEMGKTSNFRKAVYYWLKH